MTGLAYTHTAIRRILAGVALVVAGLSTAGTMTVHAATPVAGTCVFAPGSASFTTSSVLSLNLVSMSVSIQAAGTCAGNGLINTVVVDFTGTLVMSCEAGEGTLVGTATWSNGVPPSQVGFTALTVYSSGTFQLTFTTPALPGAATFVADGGAGATCALGGVSGGSLVGSMTYAWLGI